MTLDDVADVLSIDAASFRTNHTTESNLIDELNRPFARLWVARTTEQNVGAFLVAWHVVDEIHVLNVATHPALRRQGHGRALMDHVIAFARENDVRHILLEVRRSNAAAITLYRALGFFAMGIRRDYYSDGEDAIEMVLLFDPDTKEIVHRADEIRLEMH
jgi:ribosomal-protein-alanine N-acetyltransferase